MKKIRQNAKENELLRALHFQFHRKYRKSTEFKINSPNCNLQYKFEFFVGIQLKNSRSKRCLHKVVDVAPTRHFAIWEVYIP